MAACLLLAARALLILINIAAHAHGVQHSNSCGADGLYVDYESECRDYYRCSRGAVVARYACPPGRAFSPAEGACTPRRRLSCVARHCDLRDSRAYAAPGTACRHYYRCLNGTALELACPPGAWFDIETQACSRGAGTCFEPVCAGLPDDDYPDASHSCRRRMRCRAGGLVAVVPCDASCEPASCPPSREVSAAVPAGDAAAAFCSDAACSSMCAGVSAAAVADRSSGCREYVRCAAGRVVRRGVCEPGMLFAGARCRPAEQVECPAPALSPCYKLRDGVHRDWRDCASWLRCRRERVVGRGACGAGEVFDGARCVPATQHWCRSRAGAAECEGRPAGLYQDLSSACTRYFHCGGSRRTSLACPAGQVFDGGECVPAERHVCPSLEPDSCYERPDGRYRATAPGAGCRGFYACVRGDKSVYACAPGQMFDGESCVEARPEVCRPDDACAKLQDGYHPEIETNCRRYFFCERGDRLVTLSCNGGRIFDGRSCVSPSLHTCASSPGKDTETPCKDGFYTQPATDCRGYYFCVGGKRSYLTCAEHQVFNGQLCVPKTSFSCPG